MNGVCGKEAVADPDEVLTTPPEPQRNLLTTLFFLLTVSLTLVLFAVCLDLVDVIFNRASGAFFCLEHHGNHTWHAGDEL